MLLNLIKYDLKYILKTVLIYSILLLVSAVLHNLTSYDYAPTFFDEANHLIGGEPNAPTIILILHTIFYNAVIAMLIALVLNAIIRIWARFKINFYGDEAYLTHTLPVSRSTLWLAKFLSAIITIIIMLTVITITFVVLNLTPTGRIFTSTFGYTENGTISFYLTYIFAIFTQLLFITLCGLTGIIIGYRALNHRGLYAFVCGFATYFVGALVLLGFIALWGVFDPSIQSAIFGEATNSQNLPTLDFIIKLIASVTSVYAVLITISYFSDRKLLQRGINLE